MTHQPPPPPASSDPQWSQQQPPTAAGSGPGWAGPPTPAPLSPFPTPEPEQPKQKSWFRRHKITTGVLALVAVGLIGGALGGQDEEPDSANASTAEAAEPAQPAQAASGTESGGTESAESAADAAASQPAAASEEAADPAESAPAETADSSETAAAEEPQQAPADAALGVGDAARDGSFEFVITEVETGVSTIGQGFSEADAKGQYVVVHLTVSNIGDTAQYFFDSNQYLIDEQGREHSASSDAMWLEDNELTLEEINPGLSVQGVVVFDIPADASGVELRLHDSMFSGGVVVDLR